MEEAPSPVEGEVVEPPQQGAGSNLRRFLLVRHVDVTGYSGPGIVAEGIQFTGGNVVIQWAVYDKPSSIVIWTSLEQAIAVHGHDGATTVRWLD